jgi:hypothetical protein
MWAYQGSEAHGFLLVRQAHRLGLTLFAIVARIDNVERVRE